MIYSQVAVPIIKGRPLPKAKTPVCDNKTIFMIPTIKVYHKNDNAKIISM